jgi:hypothetical protein
MMQEEFESLMENGTWEHQELPKGRKIVKNNWMYKLKLIADESVDHYKTRLVTKGFTQKEGLDFKKTFKPSCEILLNKNGVFHNNCKGYDITQFDVYTTFLYGEIKKKFT